MLLLHGFASSTKANWGDTGWLDLLAANYRVLAMDCRGHGLSAKPHGREAYGGRTLVADVIRLLDHLSVPRALLMGYSMGARTSLRVVCAYPERIRAVVLGGIATGTAGMEDPRGREPIVKALLAKRIEDVTGPVPRTFRQFAEANRNDLKALAACMAADWPAADRAALKAIRIPVMIVVGSKDLIAVDADQLAAAIPGAQLVTLQGRHHLNAPGDRRYKEAVSRFFAGAPA